jgi:threonylcarbamoyladenosine tRNA methylthiotransferase MtaB
MSNAAAAPEIVNFGCRLNIAEGEAVRTLLAALPANRRRVVINGCAVTGNAMRETAVAARRARRSDPEAEVIVTGCAAQVDAPRFAAMPEVDRVLGNGEKFDAAAWRSADRVIVGDALALTRTAPQLVGSYAAHARGFLEVQNGCDHRCTFCVIPFGRGPSRSVPIARAIEAAETLVGGGHRELVLTGVDLTSWGQDLPGRPALANLIRSLLDAVPGIARLRLGSIDVAEIDGALFDLLAQEVRMMPHVHLSLQHGDDLMLKRMKRRHSRAQALAMADRLRTARPAIAIGADLIAGFPTESEAAADANRTLIADCGIAFAHVFPYSPREGTPAARMPQFDRATIKARAAALRATAGEWQARWLGSLVNSRQTMLVERGGQSGHADNFARVRLESGTTVEPGSIIAIDIIGVDGSHLIGKRAA